ncbi:MAG: hypothetical protein AAFQ94_30180 [Bacteroidota bacterium]
MSNNDKRIYLTYSLQEGYQDLYQGIYYAHILGSTFAIGAKFYDLEKTDEGIVSLHADFRSVTMDGIFNFSINNIEEQLKYQEGNSRFNLRLKLQLSDDLDGQILEKVKLTFEEPMKVEEHYIRISVPLENERIKGIKTGMIIDSAKEIDNDRSCFVKLGGG